MDLTVSSGVHLEESRRDSGPLMEEDDYTGPGVHHQITAGMFIAGKPVEKVWLIHTGE